MRTNEAQAQARERAAESVADEDPSSNDPSTARAGGTVVRLLKRLWKRRVRGHPDGYRAYVSLPTSDDASFGEVHDCIERLEYAFEGRVDVYARVQGVAAVSDPVPDAQFDRDAFEEALERLESCYAETHSVTRLEKWRSIDGELVKSYVVVPVKPLFPQERSADAPTVRATAE
ncbi:hypothetical protein [Halopiger thermotolerans]